MIKITTICTHRLRRRILAGYMSVLPKATPRPSPDSRMGVIVPTAVAALFVVLLVAQLFTFDTFIEIIPGLGLPLGSKLVFLVAPLLVVCELFALPFLLRMAISPAFRWLSMICGWAVAGGWLVISVWPLANGTVAANVGIVGTVFSLPAGAASIALSCVLGAGVAWSSWLLWPLNKVTAHKAKK